MIWDRLCVSCQNRSYEVTKGRNAKGTPPKLQLEPRRLGVVIDHGAAGARYIELLEPATVDMAEVALAALRVSGLPLAFCRPRGEVPPMTILELARMFGAKPTRLSGDDRRAADIVRRHGGGRRRGIVARAPPRARGVVT
jgi:hypothetical protein